MLQLDDGSNRLDLAASSKGSGIDGYTASGVISSQITSGADNDHLTIRTTSSNTGGETTASGLIDHSLMDAGAGNNHVGISAEIDVVGGSAVAIRASTVNTGDGDDQLWIHAIDRQGVAESLSMQQATVTTHGGDDRINIVAAGGQHGGSTWAMTESELDSGDGEDDITITGNAINSTISLGRESDRLKLSGLQTQNVLIEAGSGDDDVIIQGGSSIRFSGGDGADQLTLKREVFDSIMDTGDAGVSIADFLTGPSGDVLNIDDIIKHHASGFSHSAAITGGFVLLEQVGSDTMLMFDADGDSASAYGSIKLAVFENAQRENFSRDNFDSLLFDESQLIADPAA